MAEKKVNLASDDYYIQAFNRLKATHDVNKKVNTNIDYDSKNNIIKNDDRDDKSVSSKISSTASLTSIHRTIHSKSTAKVKHNVNNIMQVKKYN